MGSYISIHNNTRDNYNVKVGPDEAALRVFSIVATVIGALSLTIATAGIAAPAMSAVLATAGLIKVKAVAASVAAVMKLASLTTSGFVLGTGSFAAALAIFITEDLREQGYEPIRAGAKRSYGRFTLSLWRQAACTRVRSNPTNDQQVFIDMVYMRPIFSGATANSTLEHNIQFWINRWGHENHSVLDTSDSDTSSSRSMQDAMAEVEKIDWLKVMEEVRAKAKNEELLKAGIDLQEYHDATQEYAAV